MYDPAVLLNYDLYDINDTDSNSEDEDAGSDDEDDMNRKLPCLTRKSLALPNLCNEERSNPFY